MATGRQRSKSCSSVSPCPELAEIKNRIRQSIIRNDRMARKIGCWEIKLAFKRDLEIKQLDEFIKTATKTLNDMKETAKLELKSIVKSRQEPLPAMYHKCDERSAILRKILDNSNSFSADQVASKLAAMNAEMDEAQKYLDDCCKFQVQPREVAMDPVQKAKVLHVHSSFLFPSEVRLFHVSNMYTGESGLAVITIKAESKHETKSLWSMLSATLENLLEQSKEKAIPGVVMPWNDELGSAARITFSSVPPDQDYFVKVSIRGQQVSNSPMIVRVESIWKDVMQKPQMPEKRQSQPKLQAEDVGNNQPKPEILDGLQPNHIPSHPQPDHNGADAELIFPTPSTVSGRTSSLSFLAGRARSRSGNLARTQRLASDSKAVAVAPKGILMGLAAKRKRADSTAC